MKYIKYPENFTILLNDKDILVSLPNGIWLMNGYRSSYSSRHLLIKPDGLVVMERYGFYSFRMFRNESCLHYYDDDIDRWCLLNKLGLPDGGELDVVKLDSCINQDYRALFFYGQHAEAEYVLRKMLGVVKGEGLFVIEDRRSSEFKFLALDFFREKCRGICVSCDGLTVMVAGEFGYLILDNPFL